MPKRTLGGKNATNTRALRDAAGVLTVKPRLLDLFCGAGGAAMGYSRAGFEVVGVDIAPQKNYPFKFHQADALEYVAEHGKEFDAIHASPPCQAYSRTRSLHTRQHPDLYVPTRLALRQQRRPYVIENVVGAPYESGLELCGSMFGLGVWRHRNFETSFALLRPSCQHYLVPHPVDVTGLGGYVEGRVRTDGGGGNSRKPRSIAEAREVMGIDWMTRKELSQAIPPAYTEYIGKFLMQAIGKMILECEL